MTHLGYKHSLETRYKMHLAKVGKPSTRLGSKATDETKRKMSLAHKGQSNWWLKGKKLTEEHKHKMSISLKGRYMPPRSKEHARKISEALRGRKWLNHPQIKKRGILAKGTIEIPLLGDIRYGDEISVKYNKSMRYIYLECISCGSKRWVEDKLKTRPRYCFYCGGKENIAKLIDKSRNDEEYKQYLAMKQVLGRALAKPDKPERTVLGLLNELCPNQYIYTGNGGMIIGGKIPDFTNINGQKKVIEVFGDYWHSKHITGNDKEEEEIKKINNYSKYGFTCLIIWENELKDIGNVREKIIAYNASSINK